MVALRKQGMKERHWQQLTEKIGKDIFPGPDCTFTKLLEMGLMDHMELCCEVGEKA